MYEMATSQLPFKSNYEQALVYSILNESPIPPCTRVPSLPGNLDTIIARALSKDPAAKYQSAFELASLQAILTFNTAITGGTITLSMMGGSSELNDAEKPSGLSVAGNELRIAARVPPGSGYGTVVGLAPGLRVGRFRVTSSVPFATTEKADVAWKNSSDPYTKVYAYVGGLNMEITDLNGHLNTLVNPILPVTLTSFTAKVGMNGEGVHLQWNTVSEVNKL